MAFQQLTFSKNYSLYGQENLYVDFGEINRQSNSLYILSILCLFGSTETMCDVKNILFVAKIWESKRCFYCNVTCKFASDVDVTKKQLNASSPPIDNI